MPPRRPVEDSAFASAENPDFAVVVAALADEYQANNDRGRRSLIAGLWVLFLELRGGAAGREVRRLARRWGDTLLERERRQPLGARLVEVLEFAAAAGDGRPGNLVPRAGVVWFRRDRLQRLGLDPAQCAVLRGQGEAMPPTLPAGREPAPGAQPHPTHPADAARRARTPSDPRPLGGAYQPPAL